MSSGQQPPAWYVVHTKPRQEAIAQENLERQGFETYLPRCTVVKRRSPTPVLEVMFPRYLFIRPTRAEQSLSVVRSTIGAHELVRFGAEPALLSDATVTEIRHMEAQRRDAPPESRLGFNTGDRVSVTDGPLANLEGLVEAVAADRVTVLLHLLGREHAVSLPARQLRGS